jgi:hypothetical protein
MLMPWIAFLVLFSLAIVLARAKATSAARPRGRFARSVVWDFTPPLPEPRVRRRALGLARSLGLL